MNMESDAIAQILELSLQIKDLETFVDKLQAEIVEIKGLQQPREYNQELIKTLYEISDAARRIGGYVSLWRNRTADSDRWVLNRLTELGCKITHSEALINE